MPTASLDDRYLNWLTDQIETVKQRRGIRTFDNLFEQLYDTIFVAIVSHDENRIADAKDLRDEFLSDVGDVRGAVDWMKAPCTMLELFVILSRELAFEMDDPASVWFWHLIEVLDLEQFDDRKYSQSSQEAIRATLDRVIWRTYEPDGHGGLFPLRSPERDQRDVELWYQLNAYLLEQF